jgi:hypothetical protein
VQIERAKRAWILEDDARSVGEVDRRSRKSRQRLADDVDVPIARHAKVRVKHTSVFEEEQLMLSSALDVANASVLQRTELRGRYSATKRRMMQGELRDRFSNGCVAQATDGAFNLW